MGVKLSWVDTNYGESEYRIYRSTATMDPVNPPAPLATVPAPATSYIDLAVEQEPKGVYYYRVGAVTQGVEKVSAEVSADTTIANPGYEGLVLWADNSDHMDAMSGIFGTSVPDNDTRWASANADSGVYTSDSADDFGYLGLAYGAYRGGTAYRYADLYSATYPAKARIKYGFHLFLTDSDSGTERIFVARQGSTDVCGIAAARGTMEILAFDGTTDQQIGTGLFATNVTWHHVEVEVDCGIGTMTVRFDGTEVVTGMSVTAATAIDNHRIRLVKENDRFNRIDDLVAYDGGYNWLGRMTLAKREPDTMTGAGWSAVGAADMVTAVTDHAGTTYADNTSSGVVLGASSTPLPSTPHTMTPIAVQVVAAVEGDGANSRFAISDGTNTLLAVGDPLNGTKEFKSHIFTEHPGGGSIRAASIAQVESLEFGMDGPGSIYDLEIHTLLAENIPVLGG